MIARAKFCAIIKKYARTCINRSKVRTTAYTPLPISTATYQRAFPLKELKLGFGIWVLEVLVPATKMVHLHGCNPDNAWRVSVIVHAWHCAIPVHHFEPPMLYWHREPVQALPWGGFAPNRKTNGKKKQTFWARYLIEGIFD